MQYIISTYVKVRVCLCCDYVTLWVMLLWGANWCVRQGVSVLWLRDCVSYVAVRIWLVCLAGCACVVTTWLCELCWCEELTLVLGRVCLCCDYVIVWFMLLLGADWCVRQGVSLLWLRDGVSYVAVRSYLMSFTCTFLCPMMVRFVAVEDSPKLDEPCVNDSCSICSGSSDGTLYFGSPAELPYVSALIRTEILCTHQLTCYQTGYRLSIHFSSVDTTHFVTMTEADRLLLKRRIIHICVTLAWIL